MCTHHTQECFSAAWNTCVRLFVRFRQGCRGEVRRRLDPRAPIAAEASVALSRFRALGFYRKKWGRRSFEVAMCNLWFQMCSQYMFGHAIFRRYLFDFVDKIFEGRGKQFLIFARVIFQDFADFEI